MTTERLIKYLKLLKDDQNLNIEEKIYKLIELFIIYLETSSKGKE